MAHDLYVNIHEHPELSGHETRTAATLANALRKLGYQVTEHVGGTGIVAVLRNGAGRTILLRTELDALPVEEATTTRTRIRCASPSSVVVVMARCPRAPSIRS